MGMCGDKDSGISSPAYIIGGAAPVEVDVHSDGKVYVTFGKWPSDMMLVLTQHTANELAARIGSALQDAQQNSEDAVQLGDPHVCVPSDDDESGVDLTLAAGCGPDPFADNSAVQGAAAKAENPAPTREALRNAEPGALKISVKDK